MAQTWDDLLFSHRRGDAEALRRHLPDGLQLEEHDGSAWLGIVFFRVRALRARGALPVPGIWFFSLDASSALAAEAARRLYKLPYFRADITLERRAGRIFYECVRDEKSAFSGSYKAAGAAFQAEATSLEHFLTERYCLYAAERGRLYRAEIHHRPWALRPAEATIDLNTMPPDDIGLDGAPLLHYSGQQDVVIWPLRAVT